MTQIPYPSLPQSSLASRVAIGVGILLSASILIHYLLFNTVLAPYSPLFHVPLFMTGSEHRWILTTVSVVSLAGWLLLTKPVFTGRYGTILYLTVAAYEAMLSLWVVVLPASLAVKNDCLAIQLAMLLGLVAARLVGNPTRLALVLIGVTVVQALLSLNLKLIHVNSVVSGDLERAGGSFHNPTLLFTMMIVAFPVALACGAHSRSTATLINSSLAAALILGVTVMTWSRGAFLALAAGFLWFLWVSTRSVRSLAIGGALMVLLVGASFAVRANGAANAASSRRSIDGRAYVAREAALRWMRMPMGVGLTQASVEVSWPQEMRGGRPATENLADPRSVPVLWLLELGVGGILLYGFLVYGIFGVVKSLPAGLPAGFGAAWVALLAGGIFDVTFASAWNTVGTFLFGLLFGATVLIAVVKPTPEAAPCPHPPRG